MGTVVRVALGRPTAGIFTVLLAGALVALAGVASAQAAAIAPAEGAAVASRPTLAFDFVDGVAEIVGGASRPSRGVEWHPSIAACPRQPRPH